MIHMSKGAKVLKDLLSHKEKLEKAASSIKLSEECSAVIHKVLLQKEGDLGSFTLPCLIGPLAVENALADLGASINLMHEVEPLEWRAPENHLKPSIQEPPKLELKELPKHLEYTFLQGDDQLPIVISSSLSKDEKSKLLNVLRNHKGAITWSIADIKGIDSSFCTYKILMKDEYKPTVQPQRRVNQNIKEVVKKEVIKLLDARLIYPVSDSPWAFKKLKHELTLAPVMIKPDWSLPFEIMCDASDYVVGAVLGQRINNHFQPIHYASKTMNATQENYTTTEKELLAVVFTFDKFWQYLVLSKTIVFTNYSALRYLFTKQDAKSRIIRWILLLQEFDIEIRDKKGAKN
ncbi:reverse transcriptase domain-containing protein [Tanacetum coccineum]